MTMSNIKVGDRFVKWRLGYDISCTDGLPEHLHKFYEVFIVEKVNKVTFVANGEKYKEVDKYWIHNASNEKLEKLACSEAAKYFIRLSEIPYSSHYDKKDYINMLSGASESNIGVFKMIYEREANAYRERLIEKANKNISNQLKEVLGGK